MEKTEYSKKYFNSRRAELDIAYNAIKADWQELADYFLPRSVRFLARNVNKQPVKNKKIKDSTPLVAVRNFSSGMMSGATSPATNWFKVKVKNYRQESSYEIKIWCSEVENLFRDIFNSSNLYRILPSVYKQLGVFGISVFSMLSDEASILRCQLLPIGSYRIAKNYKGEIDTICRVYMDTAKNIYDKFGENNVSREVINAVKSGRFEELYEIVHFVEPNKNFMPNSVWAEDKEFISVYYEANSEENKFLSKSGFDKFPYAVFESEVNGEDVYPSECPGINALPDVKQLMSMVIDEGKAVKKMISPTYKGPASLKNKKMIDAPAAFIEEDENGRGLSPIYEVNPRVLEVDSIIEKLKESIKEIFYNDLFSMILNTAERTRTATEVNELKEEKMVLLSPLLQQIHNGLNYVIDWVFQECINLNILPEAPAEIMGANMDIEFVSTLAQAQKAVKISAMERFTTFTINLAQALEPSLRNKLNANKIIDDYAEFANISPEQIIPTKQAEKLKQKNEEAQSQKQAMEQIKEGSEIIKNLGGTDSYGSDLLSRLGLV
ncbi:MAG: portal protein [Candidatus Gastranaerophilales bacterium]|nr:portal protein [Candidatus Gastranaerophilales bacterium]